MAASRDDQRDEIQQVTQVDHALADGVETDQEAQRSHRVDQPLRRPGESVEHHRQTADDEQEAHRHREDEGDHLVFASADMHEPMAEGAGQQPAAEIAGDDHAIVRSPR